jgi:hypothetical protein
MEHEVLEEPIRVFYRLVESSRLKDFKPKSVEKEKVRTMKKMLLVFNFHGRIRA